MTPLEKYFVVTSDPLDNKIILPVGVSDIPALDKFLKSSKGDCENIANHVRWISEVLENLMVNHTIKIVYNRSAIGASSLGAVASNPKIVFHKITTKYESNNERYLNFESLISDSEFILLRSYLNLIISIIPKEDIDIDIYFNIRSNGDIYSKSLVFYG